MGRELNGAWLALGVAGAVAVAGAVKRRGGSMARGGTVPVLQRIFKIESQEGTFEGDIESMYPDFTEGEEADPNVLRLRRGASTYVGGGAEPRMRITRLK